MGDSILKSHLENLELAELIEKLRKNGCGDLVDALLNNEGDVYTKKGRLNKSGACRIMKIKTKQLEDLLEEAKNVLVDSV